MVIGKISFSLKETKKQALNQQQHNEADRSKEKHQGNDKQRTIERD